MQNEYQIRKEICEIGRNIWHKGFCAGNEGNHSVKVEDNRFLVTPTGISKGFLEPEDVVVTDNQGQMIETNARGRRPSSEVKVHLAIYKQRPDVGAVIHSHPPHATAFAVAGVPLPEGVHPEAEVFLGKVRTARFAMPSTHELPDSLTPLIDEETNSLLMGNHGSVSFSTDLTDSYYKLEILDAYCRILLLAKQVGNINTLSDAEMQGLLKIKQQFGMTDSRLACAPEGCIGTDNESFLATLGDRPMGAVCSCDGGEVTEHLGSTASTAKPSMTAGTTRTQNRSGTNANGQSSSRGQLSDAEFEAAVQAMTDQIMAGTNIQ